MQLSTIAVYLGGLATGLGVGLAMANSYPASESTKQPLNGAPSASEKPHDDDNASDSDESDQDLADLSALQPSLTEELKLVLVVRSDLGMTKGKIAAQCSHATLACFKALQRANPNLLGAWERLGQAKIALKADGEEELLLLEAQAKSLGVCARSIQDAGRTQIAAGSTTVLGIGPAPKSIVNQVTGHLKPRRNFGTLARRLRHVVAVGKQALQRSTAARKASAFALTKDASIRIPHNRAAHTPADYGAAIRDIFL